jgi:hypothetical protein
MFRERGGTGSAKSIQCASGQGTHAIWGDKMLFASRGGEGILQHNEDLALRDDAL